MVGFYYRTHLQRTKKLNDIFLGQHVHSLFSIKIQSSQYFPKMHIIQEFNVNFHFIFQVEPEKEKPVFLACSRGMTEEPSGT